VGEWENQVIFDLETLNVKLETRNKKP